MPFVKLLSDVAYKGKKLKKGDVVDVSEDLGRKMVLAGQARYASAQEFAKSEKPDLNELTKKELEALCKELGIEGCSKMKKEELVEAIRAKKGE